MNGVIKGSWPGLTYDLYEVNLNIKHCLLAQLWNTYIYYNQGREIIGVINYIRGAGTGPADPTVAGPIFLSLFRSIEFSTL